MMTTRRASSAAIKSIATYRLSRGTSLIVAQGSVVEFAPTDGNAAAAAIVNAANEGCLGGGGVDGAISDAGGRNLAKDRLALPIIKSLPMMDVDGGDDEHERDVDDDNSAASKEWFGVRCLTGRAVLTGPNDYGKLKVNNVIHAVGPNYWDYASADEGHLLLWSAYQSSLELAAQHELREIAFSLLSSGIFRARVPLKTIFRLSIQSIQQWAEAKAKQREESASDGGSENGGDGEQADEANDTDVLGLNKVFLCAFTERECETLKEVCDTILDPEALPVANKKTKALPTEDEKTKALPTEDKKTEASPVEDEKTKALPVADEKTEALPMEDEKTEALPMEEEKTEALPVADEKTEALPVADEKTEALPVADESAKALPVADESAKALPMEDEKTEALPMEDEKTEASPMEDEKTEALPMEDEKTEALPMADEKKEEL